MISVDQLRAETVEYKESDTLCKGHIVTNDVNGKEEKIACVQDTPNQLTHTYQNDRSYTSLNSRISNKNCKIISRKETKAQVLLDLYEREAAIRAEIYKKKKEISDKEDWKKAMMRLKFC